MKRNNQRYLARCQCGQIVVEVIGAPIVSTVCYCDTCQAAGHAFEREDGAPRTVGEDGGTEYCLYRKDRIKVIRGSEYLQEHRLTPDSKTRRILGRCCNSPMFLDFTQGHWLSVYRFRLPGGFKPPQMRVMTSDRPAGVTLPNDIPNYPTHSPAFMARLLLSWAAMGFRRPKVTW
ncbi:MAG: GFA family protein [Leptospirillum sp.]